GPTQFACDVLALDQSSFGETLADGGDESGGPFWRAVRKVADDGRPLWLLPSCALHLHREQQTAAPHQGNELTPRPVEHGLLPGTRCASLPQSQNALEAAGKSLGQT